MRLSGHLLKITSLKVPRTLRDPRVEHLNQQVFATRVWIDADVLRGGLAAASVVEVEETALA